MAEARRPCESFIRLGMGTTVNAEDYASSPPDLWHAVDVAEAATPIFITPGEGAEHKSG